MKDLDTCLYLVNGSQYLYTQVERECDLVCFYKTSVQTKIQQENQRRNIFIKRNNYKKNKIKQEKKSRTGAAREREKINKARKQWTGKWKKMERKKRKF